MQKIILPKGAGKTTELIKRSAEDYGYIVCKDVREASRIHNLAMDMGYKIPLPITYHEFKNGPMLGRCIKGLHIDNVEMFVQSFTNIPVKTITITDDEE